MEQFALLASPNRGTIQIEHSKQLNKLPVLISSKRLVHASPEEIVTPLLYGGFLEHMGRCIYGGLVDDPKDPSPPDLLVAQDGGRQGWRKDVIDTLGADGPQPTPLFRWPGGNFASNYHWQDGIGPISERPGRAELAWSGHIESNQFGTDEYIDWCRAMKAEPYICLNFGTGTFTEALNWVEYCNGTGDSYLARLRRKNTGREEPHNVKYWGLGNEIYGSYQIGFMSSHEYITTAKKWAKGLKLVDKTIMLVACGVTGGTDWDQDIVRGLLKCTDYLSIHAYSSIGHTLGLPKGMEYEVAVFNPNMTESHIEMGAALINIAKSYKPLPGEQPTAVGDYFKSDAAHQRKAYKMCLDEWNVWDEAILSGAQGLEQDYSFIHALAMASWLNILVRQSAVLQMACLAQSVNVISHIKTKSDGMLLQASFYPCALFATYMKGGRLIDVSYVKDRYVGKTFPAWVQFMKAPPYVDIVAMLMSDESGHTTGIRMSVVNKHPECDYAAPFQFEGFRPTTLVKHSMFNEDLYAKNTWEEPKKVVPVVEQLAVDDLKSCCVTKRRSWSLFLFEGVDDL